MAVAQIAHPVEQVAEVDERNERSAAFGISDLMVKFDGINDIGGNLPCFGKDAARIAMRNRLRKK